jgi:5'-nucleotidase (lipoprotein e(P4) family)
MRRASLLLALLACVACASAPAAPPATAPASAPPAIAAPAPPAAPASPESATTDSAMAAIAALDRVSLLPDDIRWVATSAEYEAACWQAFALATRRIDELAAGRAAGTWAVSLDADETVLGNVVYEVERIPAGGTYDRAVWKKWVERRQAIALAGARQFLEHVRGMGGKIVIVTNRREDERVDTEANMAALGLVYDLILPRATDGPGDKNPRFEAVAAGTAAPGLPPLEILLWVGDNIHDFPRLDQSLKHAPESSLAPFGDRFVLVPNPLYGSWKG